MTLSSGRARNIPRTFSWGEPLQGFWWNRSKEWSARNRGKEYGTYDFATRYLVRFAPLPAFRHLTAEDYQDMIAELIQEIREEGEQAREGNPVAGVEKILSQDPYRPPTRRTKRSPRPLFHVKEPEVRVDLREQLKAFLAQYWEASTPTSPWLVSRPRRRQKAASFSQFRNQEKPLLTNVAPKRLALHRTGLHDSRIAARLRRA